MIPELGQFACLLALGFALLLAIGPWLWSSIADAGVAKINQRLALSCGSFLIIAFLCLGYAFLVNDFTVTYVLQHSHYLLPWYYRLGALWGGHEGSLLLWVTLLGLWLIAVSLWPNRLPAQSQTKLLAILGALILGFLLFLLFTSNPFARTLTAIPGIGRDLNPLLQDPGLMLHPPILYIGYVGFAVIFAYGILALWEGQLSRAWLRHCRRWTLVAWSFLGIGIVLGSWWSYRELGWGGWWFWDPVENASLLPWLIATALLHSLVVAEKRGAFYGWVILLALLAFALSLLGTFLVRSGLLVSVHAFSTDPSRGLFLLFYLFLIIGGSLLLYALRCHTLYTRVDFSLLSREGILLVNNVFFLTATGTILLGTLYPIVLDSLHLAKISVGAPYFNKVFIPLMLPLLLLMGIAPGVPWKTITWRKILAQHGKRLLICLSLAILIPFLFKAKYHLWVAVGLFLGFWIFSSFPKTWRHWFNWPLVGMRLAHWGLGLCLLGITLSSIYNQQLAVDMQVGDSVKLAGYEFQFAQLRGEQGENYRSVVADFKIRDQQQQFALSSEQRRYTAQNIPLTKTGIQANWWRDLYVVIGPALPHGYWTVRIFFKPFIRWIWFGGLLMVLGGILCLLRKYQHDSLIS